MVPAEPLTTDPDKHFIFVHVPHAVFPCAPSKSCSPRTLTRTSLFVHVSHAVVPCAPQDAMLTTDPDKHFIFVHVPHAVFPCAFSAAMRTGFLRKFVTLYILCMLSFV